MASFFCIIDPDHERRRRTLNQAAATVMVLPHLERHTILSDTFALLWAMPPLAPHSHHRGPAGEAVVLGAPHADDTNAAFDATAAAQRYVPNINAASVANGFHLTLFAAATGDMRIEADVLGLMPVYYWQRGGVVLVASSPQSFFHHPDFSASMDLHGVASLLLTSGLSGGRTLLANVHRLAADHTLHIAPGGTAVERSPVPVARLETTPGDEVDRIHDLHTQFLTAGLRNSRAPAHLLSGGLDSRILAGIGDRLNVRPTSITFGRPADLDAACARLVAETLDLPQIVIDPDPASYPSYVRASVTIEHLAGGLYAVPMGWNLAFHSHNLPAHDRLITGLTLDAVTGGAKEVPARTSGRLRFEDLRVSRLGFKADELQRLVRHPGLQKALAEVRQELVETFDASGPSDDLRTWRMNLEHRQRFAVGVCAWRYALHAWPVLPALDRTLLRVVVGLPNEAVRNRRVQKTMLGQCNRRLAQLDIDRNYFDTSPLLRSKSRVRQGLQRRVHKWTRRISSYLGHEPRFYVRTMNIDGDGWRVARAAALSPGPLACSLFNAEAVKTTLPPAGRAARRGPDPIIDSAPLKSLTGLVAWLHQLEQVPALEPVA